LGLATGITTRRKTVSKYTLLENTLNHEKLNYQTLSYLLINFDTKDEQLNNLSDTFLKKIFNGSLFFPQLSNELKITYFKQLSSLLGGSYAIKISDKLEPFSRFLIYFSQSTNFYAVAKAYCETYILDLLKSSEKPLISIKDFFDTFLKLLTSSNKNQYIGLNLIQHPFTLLYEIFDILKKIETEYEILKDQEVISMIRLDLAKALIEPLQTDTLSYKLLAYVIVLLSDFKYPFENKETDKDFKNTLVSLSYTINQSKIIQPLIHYKTIVGKHIKNLTRNDYLAIVENLCIGFLQIDEVNYFDEASKQIFNIFDDVTKNCSLEEQCTLTDKLLKVMIDRAIELSIGGSYYKEYNTVLANILFNNKTKNIDFNISSYGILYEQQIRKYFGFLELLLAIHYKFITNIEDKNTKDAFMLKA
jgi:hypothetical protein